MIDTRSDPVETAPGPQRARRRARQQWGLVGAVLLAVCLFGVWDLARQRREAENEQRQLLTAMAAGVDANLSRQLVAADASLRGLRDDLATWPRAEAAPRATMRLKALHAAMPGVRTLLLTDREGRAIASNRPEMVGRDFGDRSYFSMPKAAPDFGRLWLTPPFVGTSGAHLMALSLALAGPDGRFDGVVTLTLEPAYFNVLLQATRYAPDMWAAVAHGDGIALAYEPPRPALAGVNLDRAGSFFRRHRDSGQPATVLTGVVAATGEYRMMAQRTVWPPGLAMDKPLVVAVSRSMEAVHAPWWRHATAYGLLYALLVAASLAALAMTQRRQRAIDRLEAEQALQQQRSARRLELALRGADLGLWDLDVRSNAAIVNERWNTMLGLPHEELDLGSERWRTRVHPDDLPRVAAATREHLESRSPRFDEIYRMRHADGHWVWVLDRAQVLERDAQGAPLRMVGTHMDMTESMQARLALEQSEQNLATTLNSIGDAVIATDADGRVVRMNGTAERLTGWTAAEALGQPLAAVFRIVQGQGRAPAIDPVRQVIEQGRTVGLANDTLLLARDGREYQIADSAAPIRAPDGRITGVVLVFSDVTERYRVQEALRANEERLRALLANLHAGVVIHAPDTQVLDANPSACRILGLTLDQLRGRVAVDPRWGFIEEDGTPMPLERYPVNAALAQRAPLQDRVVGLRRPDRARPTWALCNAFLLRDAHGALTQVVVTILDITERWVAEEELRLLAGAVARLNDVVLITEAAPLDEPGPRIVFVNEAFERLTGWRRADAIGRSPRILQGPLTDRSELGRMGAALRSGQPVRADLVNYTRQGQAYWVEIDIVAMGGHQGRPGHLVAIQRDITERKRAEQAVQAAQRDLAATLDAIPDPLFEMDLDGRYHGFHAARQELLAAPPPDLLGHTADEVLPPAAAAEVHAALQEAHVAGHSAGRQIQLNLAPGLMWFELSVARKSPGTEADPRFMVLSRDITARRHAEEQLRRINRTLRVLSSGNLTLFRAHDEETLLSEVCRDIVKAGGFVMAWIGYAVDDAERSVRVMACAGQGTDYLDGIRVSWDEAQVNGRGPTGLTIRSGRSHINQSWQSNPNVAPWRDEALARGFRASVALPLAGPGHCIGALMVYATEADAFDAQEVAPLEELARNVSIAIQALRAHRQRDAAEGANRAKTLFLANISHEIRTPMNAIIGMNYLMRQSGVTPEQAGRLDKIDSASRHLLAIINDILDLSRIEAGGLDLQHTDFHLSSILDGVHSIIADAAAAKGLVVTVDPDAVPSWLRGDPMRLRQALLNFASNAVKFTERGSVALGAELLEERDGGLKVRFWVKDTGIGIAPDAVQRIFKAFEQAEPSTASRYGGTGLGLAIAERLAQLMGGEAGVHSVPGQGSTFWFTARLQRGLGPAPAPQAGAPAGSVVALIKQRHTGARVLLAEDNEVNREIALVMLQALGLVVDAAADGAQALALAGAQPYALVLMDVQMPVLDGLAATRAIRQLPGWAHTPILALTANANEEDRRDCHEAGMNDFVAKPMDVQDLHLTLLKWLPGAAG